MSNNIFISLYWYNIGMTLYLCMRWVTQEAQKEKETEKKLLEKEKEAKEKLKNGGKAKSTDESKK